MSVNSKYRTIRLREYQGNLGGFDVCQKCPESAHTEARCCVSCHSEYLNKQATALVAKDLGIKPVNSRMDRCGKRDEDHGYWRKGKGCILPLEYRPNLCLTYWCWSAYDKMPDYRLDVNNRHFKLNAYSSPKMDEIEGHPHAI